MADALTLSGDKVAPAQSAFKLSNVDLHYAGRPIVHQLSLSITRGERVALIGPSGSGKSTVLKHLRSLAPKQVAWCPQHSGLVPMLSGFHNIFMGGLSRHSRLYNLCNLIKPLSAPKQTIQRLADQLEIGQVLFNSVDRLSGGQQQRVAIGRALYQSQDIFLGDEPVSAVDDFQADKLLSLITHTHSTVILALHDTEQALKVCDRIIGLKQGRVVLDETCELVTQAQLDGLYR
mgnify:CR=1 FL=1